MKTPVDLRRENEVTDGSEHNDVAKIASDNQSNSARK